MTAPPPPSPWHAPANWHHLVVPIFTLAALTPLVVRGLWPALFVTLTLGRPTLVVGLWMGAAAVATIALLLAQHLLTRDRGEG